MKKLVTNDKERLVKWICSRISADINPSTCNAIGLENDGELVAVVAYNQWHHPSICGHIASDGSKRWLNRAFLHAMFDYPFRQLGCARITAPIAESNISAINFVTKLGFQLEGRLRKALPNGEDRLIFGLLREECKWV